jgi:hypothetical protein
VHEPAQQELRQQALESDVEFGHRGIRHPGKGAGYNGGNRP